MTSLVRAPLLDVVRRAAGQVRAAPRGATVADQPPPAGAGAAADPSAAVPWPVAGVLLRSTAVSDYHTLEVKAFADAAGTKQIDVLRLAELSPNVLMCLLPAVPERIDISEPREGLCFGIELEVPDLDPARVTSPTIPTRSGGSGCRIPRATRSSRPTRPSRG